MLFTCFHTWRRNLFSLPLSSRPFTATMFSFIKLNFCERTRTTLDRGAELGSWRVSVSSAAPSLWRDVQRRLQVGPAHDSLTMFMRSSQSSCMNSICSICSGRWFWIRHAGPLTVFQSVHELSVTRLYSSMSQWRVGTFCRISGWPIVFSSSCWVQSLLCVWMWRELLQTLRTQRVSVELLGRRSGLWFWFCSGVAVSVSDERRSWKHLSEFHLWQCEESFIRQQL